MPRTTWRRKNKKGINQDQRNVPLIVPELDMRLVTQYAQTDRDNHTDLEVGADCNNFIDETQTET